MSLRFRPLQRADLALLAQWLAAPHVQRWWREAFDPGSVEKAYGPAADGADATDVCIIEEDGRPVGMIQRYRLADYPEWGEAMPAGFTCPDGAGIDYLIGDEARIGHGLGGRIISAFVEDTWGRYPAVPSIVVAVQQANRRSWRALEKSGFRRAWAGMLHSDDPSDEGPSYVYELPRPAP